MQMIRRTARCATNSTRASHRLDSSGTARNALRNPTVKRGANIGTCIDATRASVPRAVVERSSNPRWGVLNVLVLLKMHAHASWQPHHLRQTSSHSSPHSRAGPTRRSVYPPCTTSTSRGRSRARSQALYTSHVDVMHPLSASTSARFTPVLQSVAHAVLQYSTHRSDSGSEWRQEPGAGPCASRCRLGQIGPRWRAPSPPAVGSRMQQPDWLSETRSV